MRQTGLLLIVITLFLSQQACRSRQQSDSQPSDSAKAGEAAPSASTDVTLTDRLTELGLTNNSDWRGINLGDEFGKVKATEKGEAFESDATHVGYTVEFKNLETADMLYYQAKQKISAINVDLFLNSRNSVDTYKKELSTYFTAQYGAPKPGKDGSVWTGRSNKMITLTDVSKGKDFGLKVKLVPAGGGITASVKK